MQTTSNPDYLIAHFIGKKGFRNVYMYVSGTLLYKFDI